MATKQAELGTVTCECGKDYRPQYKRAHANSTQHQEWVKMQETPGSKPSQAAVVEPPAPGLTPLAGIMCPECGGGPFQSFDEIDKHRSGNAHIALRAGQAKTLREQQEEAQRHLGDGLPDDLLQPVVHIEWTPQERAKMVRHAFGARGWPNLEHPATVRDFLEEHHIPIAPDLSRRQIHNPNKFALV